MQTISVSLTCVFDNTNDRIGAQTYFMNKLNALKDKPSFNLTRASVVQWSDPTTNTAQVFVKDSKNYYRYTAVAECSYKTSDDYLTVQNEITSIFNDDYMNIQNIDITGLSYKPSDEDLTLEQLRAKKLNELGAAKVYFYCSHCEPAIFEGELLTTDYVDRIFTTDSLISDNHEKIERVS